MSRTTTAGYIVTVTYPGRLGVEREALCQMQGRAPFLGISIRPTLFRSKRAAEKAITASVAYAKAKDYEWANWPHHVRRVLWGNDWKESR